MVQITHPNIRTMRVARCRAVAGQVSAILAAGLRASAGAHRLTSEGGTWQAST